MEVKILAFGVARDILGQSEIALPADPEMRVDRLLELLRTRYPKLRELRSLAVAVNAEYAEENSLIRAGDEVALIPPVAGG